MTTNWNLEVHVMPKQGVNDPQGDAVRSGLHSLGFDGTRRVRVGKRITVQVEAPDRAAAEAIGREMCEKLLANPVIEEYTIDISEVRS
jgi:phosphoribosylformylglycinamidine synthase